MEYLTSPLFFSQHTNKPLGKCVNQEKGTDKWYIPWHNTRKRGKSDFKTP